MGAVGGGVLATLSRTYELNANFLSCLLGALREGEREEAKVGGGGHNLPARLEKYVIGSWQSAAHTNTHLHTETGTHESLVIHYACA